MANTWNDQWATVWNGVEDYAATVAEVILSEDWPDVEDNDDDQ